MSGLRFARPNLRELAPLNLSTFGWRERRKDSRRREFQEAGEFAARPFVRMADSEDSALNRCRIDDADFVGAAILVRHRLGDPTDHPEGGTAMAASMRGEISRV